MQFVKFAHKDFSYPVNIGDVRITITKWLEFCNELHFLQLIKSIFNWPPCLIDLPHRVAAVETQSHALNPPHSRPLSYEQNWRRENWGWSRTSLRSLYCPLWRRSGREIWRGWRPGEQGWWIAVRWPPPAPRWSSPFDCWPRGQPLLGHEGLVAWQRQLSCLHFCCLQPRPHPHHTDFLSSGMFLMTGCAEEEVV